MKEMGVSNTIEVEGPPEPYDPMCQRFAADMEELDFFVYESEEALNSANEHEKKLARAEYVVQNEGTYNHSNGHFLCDECYIKAGQPSSPEGWKCP